MVRSLVSMVALALVAIGCARPAAAEATSLHAAKQYGLGYVQFMFMEEKKLVEKHAQAAGLADVKVEWNKEIRHERNGLTTVSPERSAKRRIWDGDT